MKGKILEQFSAYLAKVLPLASNYGRKTDCDTVARLMESAESKPFVLVVCGEFKRGKSSVINALLKQEICQVADGIATASVSIIKYGEKQKVVRYYNATGDTDEEKITVKNEEIPFSSVGEFSQGTLTDLDNTLYLEIELPSDVLSDGLVIVDTPGIGSLDPRHLFLTRQVLPKADSILFVTDTTEPMMTTELDFIKDSILPTNKPYAILLNKADMISRDERTEYKREREDKSSEYCGVKVDCIPVSASQWVEYNSTGDEKKWKRSNGEAVLAAIDGLYLKYCEFQEDMLRQCLIQLLSDIRAEMEKSLAELLDADFETRKDVCLSELNKLRALRELISDEYSDLRKNISSIIENSQDAVLSDFTRDTALLSTEKLEQILNTPEAQSEHGGEYVVAQLNKELQLIGNGIDRKIDSAIETVLAELSEYVSGINVPGRHFSGGIDGKMTSVEHSLSENFVSVTRHALPLAGIVGIGQACAVTLGIASCLPLSIAAGLYYVVESIKGNRRQEQKTHILKQVTPKINVAVNELRTYIQKRYSTFSKEVVMSLKTTSDEMTAQMQEKLKSIKECEDGIRKKLVKENELKSQMKMTDTLMTQIKVFNTNPFAK